MQTTAGGEPESPAPPRTARCRKAIAAAALGVAVALLAAACTADSEADGEHAEQAQPSEATELAQASETSQPAPEEPEPVDDAAAGQDDQGEQSGDAGGVSDDDAQAMRDSDPAAYTRHLVAEAIAKFDAEGRDATIAHYSDPANVDGSWYVFIFDEAGDVLAHYQPDRVGQNLLGWVGTDANGFEFGSEMLAADESGRWVSYVYTNPGRGELDASADEAFELKNAWVVRHDELLFGSGWYVGVEDFLPDFISQAADQFRSGGLEAFLAFSTEPTGITAGLTPAAEYYNEDISALGGFLSGFLADADGVILAHFDPTLIGTDIQDLLGPAVQLATPEGRWITADDNPPGEGPDTMRIWAMDVDGAFVAAGWYTPPS